MNDGMEAAKQAVEYSTGVWHWLPFAALFSTAAKPPNRPMTTRIVEQVFVAVIAGGGSAYGINDAMQARQEEQIKALSVLQAEQVGNLRQQLRDSEIRLTAQIVELRTRQR